MQDFRKLNGFPKSAATWIAADPDSTLDCTQDRLMQNSRAQMTLPSSGCYLSATGADCLLTPLVTSSCFKAAARDAYQAAEDSKNLEPS